MFSIFFNNDGTAIVEGIYFFIQDKSASQCDTLHILLKKSPINLEKRINGSIFAMHFDQTSVDRRHDI